MTAFVMLAGCGGSGGGSSAPGAPSPPGGGAAKGTAQIIITVPSGKTTSGVRRTRYVSSATKSLVISSGGSVVTVANLSASSPGCTTLGSGALQCTVNADLNGGTSTLTFTAYDQPGGLGNKLSTASMNATITAGAVNPLNVVMNGVVQHITVDFSYPNGQGAAVENVPMTIGVLVNAQDASGNTIVGPGGYSDTAGNPVTITLSEDTSSGTTDLDALSPSTISAPGTPVTVRYNGRSPLTAIACRRGSVDDPTPSGRGVVIVPGTSRGISATTPNVATGTNALQIDNISGVFNNRNITVSNSTSNTVTSYFPYYGNTAFPTVANGMDEAPTRVLGGAATGLNAPRGVSYDTSGILYVAGSSMTTLNGYNPPNTCPNGNEPPDFTDSVATSGYGVATAPNGNVSVVCHLCATANLSSSRRVPEAPSLFDAVLTFAPGMSGPPVATLAGPSTQLVNPEGIAYDSAGNLYVANFTTNTINVYFPADQNGSFAPNRQITAGTSGLSGPRGVALDGSDNLYVASFNSNTVLVYASGANGAATPTRTFTGLNQPWGIAIRHPSAASEQMPPFIDVYVTNFGNNSISIFDPTVSGSTPAFTYQGADTQLSGPTYITFGD
ncbi:MAG: NHL repeat-containing protein [Candidatus Eremiobacteraeota bacterium]|nr:NHL repeat-containing protein [Candidatus Eremiobacteraeota bacterium]